MPKVPVEVEIPDGWELAEPTVRQPRTGEHYFCVSWKVCEIAQAGGNYQFNALILRPAWQWPAWLKAPWIAMDKSRQWWFFAHEPSEGPDDRWWAQYPGVKVAFTDNLFDFTPPPCDDWRTSKRKNPNN